MARPALRTHPRQMVLEEISMIKNELLVGYTREAEEAEEAAAAAMPATATPARPAALSTATGSALTVETVRYAPPEASAASATAASAAVAAAMAQAEQLQWRTAAYPTHVGGACGGLGDGSGGGGGGGGYSSVGGGSRPSGGSSAASRRAASAIGSCATVVIVTAVWVVPAARVGFARVEEHWIQTSVPPSTRAANTIYPIELGDDAILREACNPCAPKREVC